ncbi:MAG TPA: flagellar biosynthesis anti-sigma factor FlgM [Geobacteraceae bacterium]|nr:flagellar biosynthesis anti-sigma factor FlgM [Geobacteraceae bacterium]
MKISNEQLISVVNRFKTDPVESKDDPSRGKAKAAAQGGDRVDLSINSGDIEQLKQTMQGMSDVRSERVAALKQSIANGTYSVDGKQVAEKMLDNWKALNGDK